MTRTAGGLTVLTVLAVAVVLVPARSARGVAGESPAPKADPRLTGSTIAALLEANDGKPPATGKELWTVLSRFGKFAQLPVVFSAVRLDSGVGNPRVIIAPVVSGLSEAGVTEPSLNGRLYLAANMEKGANGSDPHVATVEFISWNALRREFDFGVIEDMTTDSPQLRIVDGGRCFACHKNKGPILGAGPWTNSTHHTGLRTLVAGKLNLVEAIPANAGAGTRDRIDGMALVAPEANAVDDAVRLGALLRLNRERFRLMNRSDPGRKAFVALLVAIALPGTIDANEKQSRFVVEQWGNDASYLRFGTDWVSLARATNFGVLTDFAPIPKKLYQSWGSRATGFKSVGVPRGGFASPQEVARAYEQQALQIQQANRAAAQKFATELTELAASDDARAAGKYGMPSTAQPSNPKAFVQPAPKVTQHAAGMVNPVLLANTIGLTEGDRKFLAEALAGAAKRLAAQKVTATAMAKQVFEGPEFADVVAGGPLPDRDDFKDRFVAGLNGVLQTRHQLSDGFVAERNSYASGPRRDPKVIEEVEAVVVPTSACLRCHDVRAGGKPRLFEPISALPFDPLDKTARQAWVHTAEAKRKHEVLTRLQKRLFTDADMPPQDSPEHELFRVKEAVGFDDLKQFLATELEKTKKP